MQLNTALPTLDGWRNPPSLNTLCSIYDASAHQWQDNLARLGQLSDYQLLFESQAVIPHLNHLEKTSQILDCGVGTGAFSLALLDSINQPVHVCGIDISSQMLTHAERYLKNRCRTLDLKRGDIRRLPFPDNSFDVVIFAHVLEHLSDPVTTLLEMIRVLKPGAPLIGSVTRKGLGQSLMSLRWHHRGYTSKQLESFLSIGGLEAGKSFNYGKVWSKLMCIAVMGVKPR